MLFYYLACERALFTRGEVAAVLWPELPNRAARHNLRTALSELRKEAVGHLAVTNSTVALDLANYWLDIEEFEQALKFKKGNSTAAMLQAACDLYRGEFLQGVSVRNASAFEEWLMLKRVEYHLLAVEGFTSLMQIYMSQQDWDAAAGAIRRLLALDPWAEEGHRNHMAILAQRGARGAALSYYSHVRTMLSAEYGMEPAKETTELYHSIRQGEIGSSPKIAMPARAQALPPPSPSRAQSIYDGWQSGTALNTELSLEQSVVGRTYELAEIEKRLCFSSCRLVTLTGLKGVGKSQLARAVGTLLSQRDAHSVAALHAHLQDDETQPSEPWRPRDGVYYVSLPGEPEGSSPIMQRIAIEVALAHGLNITRQPGAPMGQQLLNYLARRQILLILDQVIPTPIQRDLIGALLEAGPNMRILVAARHPLQLPAESNMGLEGLSTYAPYTSPSRDRDAVQFFLQQRKKRRADWFADAEDLENIACICAAVDGLPLGIELTASLADAISLDVLVKLLTAGVNDRSSTASAAPMESWRRLHGVLAYQWDLLGEKEQMALMRLSVFPDSVSWRAAQEVSMAPASLLDGLLQKALLDQNQDQQRLFMHESRRRYAERQRRARDLDAETVRRFAAYANLVANASSARLHSRLKGELLVREWASLLWAWRWSAQNPQYATTDRMMRGMSRLLAWYGYEGMLPYR
ncbi:MAG: BTAD domain-containing putative transcriptional regulator [Caldilineaceae bacterium]